MEINYEEIKRVLSIGDLISGEDVHKLKPSTIIKCVKHTGGIEDTQAIGELLIVTQSSSNPLLSIKNGALWGDILENYTFKIIALNEITIQVHS